jgi:hypothetical protein
MDGLIVVDLTQTDCKTLQRYLGAEGAAAFLSYHESESNNDSVALIESAAG